MDMKKYHILLNSKIIALLLVVLLFSNTAHFIKSSRSVLQENILAYNETTTSPVEVDYSSLRPTQKVAYLLEAVAANVNDTFWFANTTITLPSLRVKAKDFLPVAPDSEEENWTTKPELFYDPRFTLAVYLSELKSQLEDGTNIEDITMPFAWSDWVDLTLLNEELAKLPENRLNCKWLTSKVNHETRHPGFCTDLLELSEQDIADMAVPTQLLPGFIVRKSPMLRTPIRQAFMQGRSHLLTWQELPISIIFLTEEGTYDVKVKGKQRIIDSKLFENFVSRQDDKEEVELNPVLEFNNLLEASTPKLAPVTINQTLDASMFNYQQEQVDKQIKEYDDMLSGENARELTPNEANHYAGLKYANMFTSKDEPTYYKLATLLIDKSNSDSGWHYEWRFFDGPLTYKKDDTWNDRDVRMRSEIIMERLLRNWFRFSKEKGILSWIAHGPLLSWYWDGLMFPFDIDVDLQMPVSELNRLSKEFNMTLVVEDANDGFGKYLIDCSTFIHHRDVPGRDNYIDARFIDIDSGSYIDITGIGKNNEKPPKEYEKEYAENPDMEMYMDRRRHWIRLDQVSPLKYTKINGVPTYIPNDFMTMLHRQYEKGIKSPYYEKYYYVPAVRLWLEEDTIRAIFNPNDYTSGRKLSVSKLKKLIAGMTIEDKVRLLETNRHVLAEYYLTKESTQFHEEEKEFLLDESLQNSIVDLTGNTDYEEFTSQIKMSKPIRKPLFDYVHEERQDRLEYFEQLVAGPPIPNGRDSGDG